MPELLRLPVRLLLAATVALTGLEAFSQDAAEGARIYMRTPQGNGSCLGCHGPDPGANPTNILRAAGQPEALLKAMNTVSAMGFLRQDLTDQDRADVSAFLGTVVAERSGGPLQLWPRTVEFGRATVHGAPPPQRLWLRNPGTTPVTVDGLSVTGQPLMFTHDCPSELRPGTGCEITLAMGAGREGWSRAALRIQAAGRSQVLVAGTSVLGVETAASALAWANVPLGMVSFDNAPVDADGRQRRSLRLTNPGPAPAELGAMTLVGPQSSSFMLDQSCPGVGRLQPGASCDVTVSYRGDAATSAEAALQARSDQGHPPVLRLAASAAQAPARPEPEAAPANTGGGCSTRPPGNRLDPLLALLALAALAMLAKGRRSPPEQGRPGI